MTLTLPIVLLAVAFILIKLRQRRKTQKIYETHMDAYRRQKAQYVHELRYGSVSAGSDPSDKVVSAYLMNRAKATEAEEKRDRITRTLRGWAAIAGFFSKRWAGVTNVMVYADVMAVVMVVAMFFPGVLKDSIDLAHDTGWNIVKWSSDTTSEIIPSAQRVLREDVLGFETTPTPSNLMNGGDGSDESSDVPGPTVAAK